MKLGEGKPNGVAPGERAEVAPAPVIPASLPALTPGWKEEKRIVCVMFCDLSGYSEMSAHMPVEELPERLNLFLDLAAAVIRRYGGTVSKIIGDSVLALFGYPTAREDDVVRAALAALDIQKEVRDVARARGLDLSMTAGIHTGEVLTTILHAGDVREVTIVGEAVNVARQLQEMAAPNEILLAEDLVPTLTNYCKLQPRGTFVPKGREDQSNLYHLAGWLDTLAPPSVKFLIGRTREIERFEELAEKARKGEGAIFGVVGDAGVGKTTLLQEFRERAEKEGMATLAVRAFSHHSTSPYRALCDHIGQLLKIPAATASLKPRERRLLKRLAAYETDLSKLLPDLEPEKRRAYLFGLFQQMVYRVAQKQPLCILLDDLQWLDEPSRQALEAFLPFIRRWPVLVCYTSRPGRRLQLPVRDLQDERPLKNWSLEEVREAVRAFHPACYHEEACVRKLYETTEGNPLFLREVLNAMNARGSTPSVDVDGVKLPPTIGRAVQSKMDGLGAGARRLADAASVIGEQFSKLLLQKVTGGIPGWEPALEELERAGVLVGAQKHPWPVYEFARPLYQRVLYDTLLRRQRAEIHGRVARAMESIFERNPGRVLPRLAEHFLKAGDRETAARKFIEAGEMALNGFALRLADNFFKQAQGALTGERALEPPWRLRWARGSALTSLQQGEFHRALPLLRQWATTARRIGAREGYVESLIQLGQCQLELGKDGPALETLKKALSLSHSKRFMPLLPEAHLVVANIQIRRGSFPEARQHLTRALRLLEAHANPRVQSRVLDRMGFVEKEVGNYAEALDYFRKAYRFAQQHHDLLGQAGALSRQGMIYGRWGQYYRDIAVMGRARQIYESLGATGETLRCNGNLAFSHSMMGEPERAGTIYEDSIALFERLGDMTHKCYPLAALGETYWNLARFADSIRVLEESRALADRAGLEHTSIASAGSLATLYSDLGCYTRALALLRPLLQKARKLDMKEFVLRGVVVKAQILRETGAPKRGAALLEREVGKPEFQNVLGHAGLLTKIQLERGMLQFALGNRKTAEALLGIAVKQARRAGAIAYSGLCYVTLAEVNPQKWLPKAEVVLSRMHFPLFDLKLSRIKTMLDPTEENRRRWQERVDAIAATLPEGELRTTFLNRYGLPSAESPDV